MIESVENHILDRFIEFEKKNELFNWRIDNIPIWELIRWKIYSKLDPAYTDKWGKPEKNIFARFKFFLFSFFFKNPYKIKDKKDIVFINHPRRKYDSQSGFYDDIYTDPFLKYIPSSLSYIVLESVFQWTHFSPSRTKNLYYLDRITVLNSFFKKIIKYKLSANDYRQLEDIQQKLNNEFGVTVTNIERIVVKEIISYRYIHKKLTELFIRLNPKRLIVVVSYFGLPQIACIVAKELKIPTYELQHGTIGKYHVCYNFPMNTFVNFFPDFFVSWGKFWTENARFPSQGKIIYAGFPHLNNAQEISKKGEKGKYILVVSQMSIDLAIFVQKLSKHISHKILFKPHPMEYSEIDIKYDFLKNIGNVEILDDPQVNIYELYGIAEYVLGVNSTSLIEALAFETKIIILKFPGWEYFSNINNQNVFFVNTVEEIIRITSIDRTNFDFDRDYFFVEKSTSEFVNTLLEENSR